MSENKLDLCHVCCCCWEKFGVNSKALRNVNSTVDDLMKLYIFPGFSTDVEDYPTTICYLKFFFFKIFFEVEIKLNRTRSRSVTSKRYFVF